MLTLSVKVRQELGKKIKTQREKGILPGVLYGPEIKNLSLEIDGKQFEKIYREAGESSLISLEIGGKKALVLIHETQSDPLTGKPIHVDFYQPKLGEEIAITVPLVFEGEAQAVKDLGGTLVRNIQELEVKALPQDFPREIVVNIEKLKSFEDNILVKDLIVPKGVKILKEPEEIIALVVPPEKAEEELTKPIEQEVE